MLVTKTNNYGDVLWIRSFGGPALDRGLCVVQTVDGGYAVAGYSHSYSVSSEALVVKVDEHGVGQWEAVFGNLNDDFAWSMLPTQYREYIIIGSTGSYGNGGMDVWLLLVGPHPYIY